MFRVPPEFIQSTKSCWNRHAMLHMASMFGAGILSPIEKSGSFSWNDMIFPGTCLLCILSSSHGFYTFIPANPQLQYMMGYKFIFIPLVSGTFFTTAFNTFCAIEYSTYDRYRNCGFGFAYTAFMRGTLEGLIAGVFGVLVGTAFIHLTLQNIIITRQALNLYRRFRDDHYRRKG